VRNEFEEKVIRLQELGLPLGRSRYDATLQSGGQVACAELVQPRCACRN
jgi:hypothetical protein